MWDLIVPVPDHCLSSTFLSQINSQRLVHDSYPLYIQKEILRISLIEAESGKESEGNINISVEVIGNV